MNERLKFNRGDRVFVRPGRDFWCDGQSGTVIETESDYAGLCGQRSADCQSVAVRFDGFTSYGADPSNHHPICWHILEHEVTDEEVEAALQSIAEAVKHGG